MKNEEINDDFYLDKMQSIHYFLDYEDVILEKNEVEKYKNGQVINSHLADGEYWVKSENLLFGLAKVREK